MASSALPEADPPSRLAQVIIPCLDRIIKNASWRKHAKLAAECKAVIDRLSSPPSPPADHDDDEAFSSSSDSLPGPLHDGPLHLSLADADLLLSPLLAACASTHPKITEPALDCAHKLIAHSFLLGEADPSHGGPGSALLARFVAAICSCRALGDDVAELMVIRTLLSAVTSTAIRIHGDSLLLVIRTCYDIYLESKNVVNQTTAKASLVQMLVIVFRRMEADSSTVPVQPIVVAELMEPQSDKAASSTAAVPGDVNMTQFVQGFITKIIQDIDVVLNPSTPSAKAAAAGHDGAFETTTVETANAADLLDSSDKDMLDAKYWEISMYKTALEGRKGELAEGEVDRDDDMDVQIGNKLRRDAFLVFRALCKLSMKSPPKEAVADHSVMRGKIVALELLKILLENAGAVFRTSERYFRLLKLVGLILFDLRVLLTVDLKVSLDYLAKKEEAYLAV